MASLKLAADAKWHVSQGAVLGRWVLSLMILERGLVVPWQDAQSRGVPLNTPLMWQLSQRTRLCGPVITKPVLSWSKSEPLVCACAVPAPVSNCNTNTSANSRLSRAAPASRQILVHCQKPGVRFTAKLPASGSSCLERLKVPYRGGP